MMNESTPYMRERLNLLATLAKYGPGSLPIRDVEKTKDKTCIMVGNWRAARTEEARLRAETLRCVTFTAKGKIEVHDPETLEALNARISELMRMAEAIENAVAVLHDRAPGYLCELEAARDSAQLAIESAPRGLNVVLGTELKDFHAPTPEAAMQSHRYHEAKQRSEATILNAEAKLKVLEPQIALIREQLATYEAVKVSVEMPMPDGYKSVISRDKAGVMG